MASEAKGRGVPNVLVLLDEAQFVSSEVLSTFKSVLAPRNDYLVVLAIAIPNIQDSPARLAREHLDKIVSGGGDRGAVRFFEDLEIGPFKDDSEVGDCVKKRLETTGVVFDDNVIKDISFLSERVPWSVVETCSKLFQQLVAERRTSAGSDDLRAVFYTKNSSLVDQATDIVDVTSSLARPALELLCRPGTGFSLADLVAVTRLSLPELTEDRAEVAVRHLIDEILSPRKFVQATDVDRYRIVSALHAFAIRYAVYHE